MNRQTKIELLGYYLDEAKQCSQRALVLMQELEQTNKPLEPLEVWEPKRHYTAEDQPAKVLHPAEDIQQQAETVAAAAKQITESLQRLQAVKL